MRTYPIAHRNPRRLRYGWRLSQSGHLMVDAQQRACIYRILRLRRMARTLQQICKVLAAEQCPPPRSGVWYCATVRKIIDQNESIAELLASLDAREALRSEACARPSLMMMRSTKQKTYAPRKRGMHQTQHETEGA